MHTLQSLWYEGVAEDKNDVVTYGCVAGSLRRERLQYGQYERLMAELRMEDVHSLFTFLRMQPEMFDKLLNSVGPIGLKVKRTTRYGENLWNQVYIKLAITLRHLAAGDEYPTLQFCFRVARTQFRLSFQSCARQLLKNIWMKLLLALLPQMNGGT